MQRFLEVPWTTSVLPHKSIHSTAFALAVNPSKPFSPSHESPNPSVFKSWRPLLLWGSSPQVMRTQHYWRKQETRQQQSEDPESDESRLSSRCFHCLKCSSCLGTSPQWFGCCGELTWGNVTLKMLQRSTEVIAKTQPWRNEICNKAVSSHSLCALFEDVKRSKECTPATWGLMSAGYCTTTEGSQMSVHGSKWLGNLCSRHCQEQEELPWVSCKRLRENAKGKTLQGKKVTSPQHPSHLEDRGVRGWD